MINFYFLSRLLMAIGVLLIIKQMIAVSGIFEWFSKYNIKLINLEMKFLLSDRNIFY